MKDIIKTDSQTPNIKDLAKSIVIEAPQLSDLNADQLEAIAKLVITDRLKDQMKKAVNLAGIDYEAEKARFLETNSKTASKQTARAYKNALKKLEAYAEARNISPLELTPATADDFINDLKKQDFSPATIRQAIATASSFFTYLERRVNNNGIIISNPFRGTKARPAKKLVRACQYPTAIETNIIIDSLPAELSAIVYIMAFRGLRAGAFPGLKIHGKTFETRSKGKDITGELSEACINKIKALGVNTAEPFTRWTAGAIQQEARYYITKLFKAGKISAIYSVHDFRHFYATQEYNKDKDIYRVSKLLGHASIQVTENYLRGLKVIL
ncbi:MAG: phage integrase N-terminal SAM-like domain-containing protein [Elusimicrobiaceae bacterium]|nr:phage integrase N-terminal SAM-like domain-containing protein [Elusimicrobiaceae bacterium]MBR5675316.1 phage integrase N-terminal SAM-like domain-containing protein [Neisseriaceae bacterium]